MAEIAALSLAANIIQVVTFGAEALQRLREYQNRAGEIPEIFRHISNELPVLLRGLEKTRNAINNGRMNEEDKKALLPVVEGCGVQVRGLQDVIDKVIPQSGDSRMSRSRKALTSLLYEGKMNKITGVIRNYIQTLTYDNTVSIPMAVRATTKPVPCTTVPFRRDEHFIYRKVLADLVGHSQQPASRAAIVGLGGVGKSQIAIEFSYRIRDRSPDMWVFWVHAGTQARFEDDYRRIAEVTKMEGWNDPKADILTLVRSWLRNESHGQKWVMIVDNADDANVFFPTEADNEGHNREPLSEFIPESQNGSILFTSRNHDLAEKLAGQSAYITQIEPMDKDIALSLLRTKLGANIDQKHASELLEVLDYMPLAISQAAVYIEQRAPRMTVLRYVEEVRKSEKSRANMLQKDMGDNRRDGRSSNSIMATWQISFEHIRKRRPMAARLLSLMSFFDRQGIPERLICDQYQQAGDSEPDFEEDIHTLISYSLVRMNEDGNEFEMHRLVQFSTKRWLELNNELDEWNQVFINVMNEEYPLAGPEDWAVCRELSPHIQAAVSSQPTDKEARLVWASLLYKAAWFLDDVGYYNQALELGRKGLKTREEILGPEDPDTLASLNDVGLVLWRMGELEESQAIHQRATDIREKALGPDHEHTLKSKGNLALTLHQQRRYKEAEKLNIEVLEARKRTLGEDHEDTLLSINNLATTYGEQGQQEEAEVLYRQVIEGRTKLLGPEHPMTLSSRSNLASSYLGQGRSDEAETLEREVLALRTRVLGEDHPDTLVNINNLAWTLKVQGKDDEAIALMQSCIPGLDKALGPQHSQTIESKNTLSNWRQEKEG